MSIHVAPQSAHGSPRVTGRRQLAVWLFAAALSLSACAAGPAQAPRAGAAAPKAYMVVTGNVRDREAFAANYVSRLPPLYARYGGTYLAVGRAPVVLEGALDASSYVISEWPSKQAAMAFWNSPEYDALRRERIAAGWADFTVFLVEGIPPTQIPPMAREGARK